MHFHSTVLLYCRVGGVQDTVFLSQSPSWACFPKIATPVSMLTTLPFTSLLPTAEIYGMPSAEVKSLWGSGFGLGVMHELGQLSLCYGHTNSFSRRDREQVYSACNSNMSSQSDLAFFTMDLIQIRHFFCNLDHMVLQNLLMQLPYWTGIKADEVNWKPFSDFSGFCICQMSIEVFRHDF